MKKFNNNRTVTLNDLLESGLYHKHLIQNLLQGNFDELQQIPIEQRADKDYMEPLLFAVKNQFYTYQVYQYCAGSLQEDINLASEIIITEPNLIEGTPISKNKKFIAENIEVNPSIIKYMSPELKQDKNFIRDLSNTKQTEVIKELANNCEISMMLSNNPELSNNKEFMEVAIREDINFLQTASEELKNDYQFLKEQSSKNEEVISYVANNVQYFGIEGIKAVRESSREFTVEDCMKIIDELSQNSDDKRYQKVKEKVKERGIEDVHTVRWVTAMVAQSNNVHPDLMKKVLNYSILTMERNKKDTTQTQDTQISVDNVQEFITPSILKRLREKIELQGEKLEDDMQTRLEDYETFYGEYYSRFQEQKRQRNKGRITIKDVESRTKNVNISEVQQSISETREAIMEDKGLKAKEENQI